MIQLTKCIEWTGTKHKQGYGRLILRGKLVLAHRVAYCEQHGLSLNEIAGMVVRHKCDNPSCVNPEHLEIGTQSDNVADCESRGRARHPSCESNGRAKLTAEDVLAIRKRCVKGCRVNGVKAIARDLKMSDSTIGGIVSGVYWVGV